MTDQNTTLTVRFSPTASGILKGARFDAYPEMLHRSTAEAHFATIENLDAKVDIELDLDQRWAIAQFAVAVSNDKALTKGLRSSAKALLRIVDPDLDLRVCEPPTKIEPSTDAPAAPVDADPLAAIAASAGDIATDAKAAAAAKPEKKKKSAKPATVPVDAKEGGPLAALRSDATYRPSATTLARFQGCLNACVPLTIVDGAYVEAPEDADPTEVTWVLTWAALVGTMDALAAAEDALGNPTSPVTAWYTRAGSHWRTGIGAKTAKACGFDCIVKVRKGAATTLFRMSKVAAEAPQTPAEAAAAASAEPDATPAATPAEAAADADAAPVDDEAAA